MSRFSKFLPLAVLLVYSGNTKGQELFVFTEPASNMPTHSVGIRLNNLLVNNNNQQLYQLLPEVMWGVNRNLMLHAEAFLGQNVTNDFSFAGGTVYGKYRLFSSDEVHRHTRFAAYGRLSSSNRPVTDGYIMGNGYNSGWQGGLVLTQLLHKTALSVNTYWDHVTNNRGQGELPPIANRDAWNISLSAGRLLLPIHYRSYRQTNMNVMAELLWQHIPGSNKDAVDIAPSVQFIFNSQARVDIGWRGHIAGNINRNIKSMMLLRFEYLIFNVHRITKHGSAGENK